MRGSGLIRLDREGELRIDVPAVLARGVRELGVAALGAADVVDRLEGQVGAALALARLAVLLNRKHDGLLPTASRVWVNGCGSASSAACRATRLVRARVKAGPRG